MRATAAATSYSVRRNTGSGVSSSQYAPGSDAARVEHAGAVDSPVELDVRVSAHDDPFLHARQERTKPLPRRQRGDRLGVAAGCGVAEVHAVMDEVERQLAQEA